MKIILRFLVCSFLILSGRLFAQTEVKLDPNGDFGKWTEWVKDTVKGDDGTLYTWEYRLCASKRRGLAVYYNFEVKNTGAFKLDGRINFTYVTAWMPTNINESEAFKIKPGATAKIEYIQQGCKKTDKSKTDYQSCLECPISYRFFIKTK